MDSTGALCSKASGHAIDALGTLIAPASNERAQLSAYTGDHLVLRHRRPVTYPYPNAYSHPLPQFTYDPQSGRISLTFDYPPYGFPATADWTKNTYLLVSAPKRRPSTVIDNASKFFTTAVSSSMTMLAGIGHKTAAVTPDDVFGTGDIDLKEDEIMDEDRGEENEVDDSAEALRLANIICIPKAQEGKPVSERANLRRQWEILSLRATRARFSGEFSPKRSKTLPASPPRSTSSP